MTITKLIYSVIISRTLRRVIFTITLCYSLVVFVLCFVIYHTAYIYSSDAYVRWSSYYKCTFYSPDFMIITINYPVSKFLLYVNMLSLYKNNT